MRTTRPFPLHFDLPGGVRALRVERVDNPAIPLGTVNGWRLWLNANGDFTLGTFIQLLDNGKINRVTWLADGTEHVFEVKES